MLKRSALRRIMSATLALIIVSIIYFFPHEKDNYIKVSTTFVNANLSPIYLLDYNNYVVRTNLVLKSDKPLDYAKEIISALTIGNEKTEYIPKDFKPIIPKNTKLIDISLQDGLLKLNFTKEFLNTPKEQEEKLIEALVYSLTEHKEITQIMIFIENTLLKELPQSKKQLPNTIDRSFGINKVYDLDNLKNISKTTIYYIGKSNDITYYIPVTKIDNNQQNKVEIILEELKSSPTYEANLMSYLASNVELENYEILEHDLYLTFNNEIFSDFDEKNIKEEVKYSISLSMQDSLQVQQVFFKVNDELIN